ncbi:hypothetical protein FBZ94_103601 [Bradyrhizobium sacchari]|uniref:Uncharacterized protein n=1 Tax=Bradyrhizobium sacchari TaxID=1399419 RepID=A0A560JYK6_9BRAD|nr:hypothetical protein FBZ94_103601 [Bradyrhizobium sacchari]TWB76168.1 hypothetical protein FBZ95_104349 [Bradyrhizobium sacchari]
MSSLEMLSLLELAHGRRGGLAGQVGQPLPFLNRVRSAKSVVS